MKIHDALFGLFFVALGAAVLIVVSGYPKMPGQDVGPALFPGAAGALIAMFGLALFVRARRAPAPGRALVAFGDWTRSPRNVAAVASVVGGALVYALFAQRIGFLIIAPALLLIWHLAFGVRPVAAAASAVVTSLVVWGLFYKGLGVPLPWGLLKTYAF